MRSRALGQNFLQNRRTARRVAHLAGEDQNLLCVDLGAGAGVITEACLLRSGPVLAIEVDPRLADGLRERFAAEPRVTVMLEDLSRATLPSEPFCVAANPPFNLSTLLVRRWITADQFRSGALIVEKPFAGRISGAFGATKLSISIEPYLALAVPFDVRPAEFRPSPRVDAAILTAVRRPIPLLPWQQRTAYWTFVNFLFETGRHTVGEAIGRLRLSGIPESVRRRPMREIRPEDAIELFEAVRSGPPRARSEVERFEAALPPPRRTLLGDTSQQPTKPAAASARTPAAKKGRQPDHRSRPRR